jgi:hypothetical protein
MEAIQGQGAAGPVGKGEVAVNVEHGVEGNGEVVGNSGASGSSSVTTVHPTVIGTYIVDSQHMAQNGDAASDGNGEHHQLPFYRTHRFHSLAAIPR